MKPSNTTIDTEELKSLVNLYSNLNRDYVSLGANGISYASPEELVELHSKLEALVDNLPKQIESLISEAVNKAVTSLKYKAIEVSVSDQENQYYGDTILAVPLYDVLKIIELETPNQVGGEK